MGRLQACLAVLRHKLHSLQQALGLVHGAPDRGVVDGDVLNHALCRVRGCRSPSALPGRLLGQDLPDMSLMAPCVRSLPFSPGDNRLTAQERQEDVADTCCLTSM